MKTPVFTPTHCASCLTHKDDDGFIDFLTEDVAGHRLYLCARCVWHAARLVGCLDPEQAAKLEARAHVAEHLQADLEDALREEKQNKVVDLATVRQLVGEIRTRQRTTKPAA